MISFISVSGALSDEDDLDVKKKLVSPSVQIITRDWDTKSLLTLTISMMILIGIIIVRMISLICNQSNSCSSPVADHDIQEGEHPHVVPGQTGHYHVPERGKVQLLRQDTAHASCEEGGRRRGESGNPILIPVTSLLISTFPLPDAATSIGKLNSIKDKFPSVRCHCCII